MKRGLVIGKFYPPHKGHHFLIETALSEVDQLDILICDNPRYAIAAETRLRWLQELHPDARVRIIKDLDDDDNSKAWARHTTAFLGYRPDVVFSSEDYGDTYAKYLRCVHRKVDKDRTVIPICATDIRKDVLAKWQFMQPIVRQQYCIRICVLGAESTGTTTLSKALAEHYKAPWVPELGRSYNESIAPTSRDWSRTDFMHIAQLQNQYEDAMAGLSEGIIFCDTNAVATTLWEERYLGTISDTLTEIAKQTRADLYIVTGDEIPFVQDGLRDGELIRHDMHGRFIQELATLRLPYMVVRGTRQERLKQATEAIDRLKKQEITI